MTCHIESTLLQRLNHLVLLMFLVHLKIHLTDTNIISMIRTRKKAPLEALAYTHKKIGSLSILTHLRPMEHTDIKRTIMPSGLVMLYLIEIVNLPVRNSLADLHDRLLSKFVRECILISSRQRHRHERHRKKRKKIFHNLMSLKTQLKQAAKTTVAKL